MHELAVGFYAYIVADYGFGKTVPHIEIRTFNSAGYAESSSLFFTHRVFYRAFVFQVQGYRFGNAVQGQVTGKLVRILSCFLNGRAFEIKCREFIRIKKIALFR